MKIYNHTFMVTGGASGLGLATATMLVRNGAQVALLDINTESGTKAQEALGDKSIFIQTDVASSTSVEHAVTVSKNTFGDIHGIINCAGIGPAKRVVGKEGPHDLDFFQSVININLVGTFNTIRLVSQHMQHNPNEEDGERGIVINTASIAAFEGQIGQAAYAASKGGIVAMTLPIAREFARMGIRVMCIAPGIFETPLLAGLPQEAQDSLGAQVPFPPRLGKPGEYARLVKDIIENPMLNGTVIRLDGALRMAAK